VDAGGGYSIGAGDDTGSARFLLDKKANRIGALLLHLAATEKLYQLNTFDQVRPQDLQKTAAFQDWDVPMELGEPARQAIKGHDLEYYLNVCRKPGRKRLPNFVNATTRG
jgi:hypothetical protein